MQASDRRCRRPRWLSSSSSALTASGASGGAEPTRKNRLAERAAGGWYISFRTVPLLAYFSSSRFMFMGAAGSVSRSTGASASAISALRSWMARVTRARIWLSALSNWP